MARKRCVAMNYFWLGIGGNDKLSETIENTTSFRFIELSKVMSKVAIYRITAKTASSAET